MPVDNPTSSEDRPTTSPRPQLSARHAFAMLVSIQIGSGIFSSPAQVDTNVPSPFLALVVWFFAGLLSWAGAASFAELGTVLPSNGGLQEYLRYIYGDSVSSLMSWIWIMAVKPCSMGIQGIVLAESIGAAVGFPNSSIFTEAELRIIGIAVVLLTYLINLRSTAASGTANEVFTAFKLMTVAGIALGAVVVLLSQLSGNRECSADWCSKSWFQAREISSGTSRIDWKMVSWPQMIGHYAVAMYAGLWAYSGWDNAGFIADDLQNVEKALPIAIHSAMMAVMLSLEFVNISYYIILPWKEIGSSNAVAVVAARTNLGPAAAVLVAFLVSISCAGVINSQMFACGRLIVSAAQRGYLPSTFAHLDTCDFMNWSCLGGSRSSDADPKSIVRVASTSPSETQSLLHSDSVDSQTARECSRVYEAKSERSIPARAMLLNASMTCFYIFVGSFGFLVTLVGMAAWAFFFLAGLGVIILRKREPNTKRPYRVWLVVPRIFCVMAAVIVISSMIFAPIQGSILFGLFLIGWFVQRLRAAQDP